MRLCIQIMVIQFDTHSLLMFLLTLMIKLPCLFVCNDRYVAITDINGQSLDHN